MPADESTLMISISGVRGVIGPALQAEVACRMAAAFGTSPCSSLRSMEHWRACAYCKYGPVLPSAFSIRSQSKT